MSAPLDQSRAIPVTVLTGFLGAGKTTVLNHLLKQPDMADTAVLINEFGEVGIDHHLVEKIDDTLVLLDSGCLCCSVRGDLTRSLRDLFMKRMRREIPPFSRVLIETTGLADPAPVIYTLMEDFFIAERYRSDGVVTVVDVIHGERELSRHFEAFKQIAMADRILFSKCDLASPEQIEKIKRRVARLNPGAPCIEISRGEVAAETLLGVGLYDPQTKTPDVRRWMAEEAVKAEASNSSNSHTQHTHDPNRHDARVHSFVLRFQKPFAWADFAEAMDVLLSTCGDRILRVKGLINVEGTSAPRVVHCVQHIRYPELALPTWPDEDHDSRLVFIVYNFERQYVEKAFSMFCDAVAI